MAPLGTPRASGKPAIATMRKIGILLDLVRFRRVALSQLIKNYECSKRTILRDLQELRAVGASAGFDISGRHADDTIELARFKADTSKMLAADRRVRRLIGELTRAFGEPLGDLSQSFVTETRDTPDGKVSFLHVVQPQLTDGSGVKAIYDAVESAWRDDARIEFQFDGNRREVEPYAAIVRSGRWYLLARDIKKGNGGWRRFAMDRIELPIVRRGTFVPEAVPKAFLGDDSLGWFKSGAERRVDVTVSAALARTAASRKWQDAQTVSQHENGTVTLSFAVSETEEVVRWALGFGDEAWVSGPAEAVATAKVMLVRIAARYAAVPSI